MKSTLTVWQSGEYKVWGSRDAINASSDPDFVVNIALDEIDCLAQAETNELDRLVDVVFARLPAGQIFYQCPDFAEILGIRAATFRHHCRAVMPNNGDDYRFRLDCEKHIHGLRRVLQKIILTGRKTHPEFQLSHRYRSQRQKAFSTQNCGSKLKSRPNAKAKGGNYWKL
jgi:hypothetical protein